MLCDNIDILVVFKKKQLNRVTTRVYSQTNSRIISFAVPEGVLVPVLMALSSTEIQISWSQPQFPNGVIQRYGLYGVSNNMEMMLIASFNGVASYIVDGLQPFTEYSFLIEACTSVGCNRSEVTSTLTLESGETYISIVRGSEMMFIAVLVG